MPTKKAEKLTAAGVMAAINKAYGAGTVKMADDPSLQIIRQPTGLLPIDDIFMGGIPLGRMIEIYGGEGIGKSALAMWICGAVQRAGGLAAWVDCEKRFHGEFAERQLVDLPTLALHEQDSGPVVVDFMDALIRSRLWNVIVLDSISALIPKEEHDKSMDAGSMGMEQAKLMSKALRKLTSAMVSQGTILIFLNQTREAVNVKFGDKTATSGGRAMKFYATTRLELVRTETIKRSERVINQKTGEITYEDRPAAHRIMVRVKKDSTGVREGETTTLVFDHETGTFDQTEDLIFVGRQYGLVHKGADPRPKKGKKKTTSKKTKGSWWWVDDYAELAVNGRDKFRKFLTDNPKIAGELREWIVNSIEDTDEDD